MQRIEIPELPVLRGEVAKKALQDYIKELEERKSDELTDNQTKALIKLAKGLLSSIEAVETLSAAPEKRRKEKGFMTQFKKSIANTFHSNPQPAKPVSY